MAHSENDNNYEGTLLVYDPHKGDQIPENERDVHLIVNSQNDNNITFCLNHQYDKNFVDEILEDFPVENIPLFIGGGENVGELFVVIHKRPDLIVNSVEILSYLDQKGTGIYVSEDEMIGQIGLYLELGHIEPHEFKIITGFQYIDFRNSQFVNNYFHIHANEKRVFGESLESEADYWKRLHAIGLKERFRLFAQSFSSSFSHN
mgnify:FL=1